MNKTQLKKELDQFNGSYEEACEIIFGDKKSSKLSLCKKYPHQALLVLKAIAKKQDDRHIGDTAPSYYSRGSTVEVVPVSDDPTMTKWGYKKEKVTKTVLLKRIKHMKQAIKNGEYEGRALQFARHHLHGLIRQLETLKSKK